MTGLGINYGEGMYLHNFALTKGNNFYYFIFACLDKEAPPKEVYSKKEETVSHRIATSILYDLNLRLEVKQKMFVLLSLQNTIFL